MKKFKYIIPLLAATFLLTACDLSDYVSITSDSGNNKISDTSQTAKVCFIDVGQGDSELIMTDDITVLIDGGERREGVEVLDILDKYDIDHIDYVVATHPHSDHIGGLVDILYDMIKKETDITIGEVITSDLADSIVPTTKVYTYFLQDIDSLGIKFTALTEDKEVKINGGSIKFIAPPVNNADNLNNESVVTLFNYGDTNFLFMGDAEIEEEDALINKGEFDGVNADVLKLGHHGSSTSSGNNFLSKIDPKYAVISCGLDNEYGHPHKKLLKRISKYVDKIYRTDEEGDILLQSDGTSISKVAVK